MPEATSVLFGIEDEFDVTDVARVGPGQVKIIIEMASAQVQCPVCGVITGRVKDPPLRRINDVPAAGPKALPRSVVLGVDEEVDHRKVSLCTSPARSRFRGLAVWRLRHGWQRLGVVLNEHHKRPVRAQGQRLHKFTVSRRTSCLERCERLYAG